jgi:hypothetical protein
MPILGADFGLLHAIARVRLYFYAKQKLNRERVWLEMGLHACNRVQGREVEVVRLGS